MAEVKYTGETRHFSANLVADGGYVVDVKQVKTPDRYKDPHGLRGDVEEQITEVAVNTDELRSIFNRCFPRSTE
jgi:hypothetical protein